MNNFKAHLLFNRCKDVIETLLTLRTQCVILQKKNRKIRFYYFGGNWNFVVDKGIDMHICRKFLSDDILRVMLFIKLCCAFIAYPNIHYVLHCQLIRNLGYVNLLIFSFVILHVGMNVNSILNVNKFYLAYRVTMPRYILGCSVS